MKITLFITTKPCGVCFHHYRTGDKMNILKMDYDLHQDYCGYSYYLKFNIARFEKCLGIKLK